MRAPAAARLARSLRGRVLTAEAAGYDEARRIFNAGREGAPAAIVHCADAADVQVAVRIARDEQLPLAVRAGGHSLGGYGAVTGATVLDLRPLKAIAIDRAAGIVSVGGGCTWGELLAELEAHGYTTPGGFDGRVGVAGLTLGGGYGALARAYGLSCDNLIGAEVVTASAERIVTGEGAEPDLLWALRGAGANFGVVTRLDLRLHPLSPLQAGVIGYPLPRAPEVLRLAREMASGLPDAGTLYAGLSATDPMAELYFFYLGTRDDAVRWLKPIAALGRPLHADLRAASYARMQEPKLGTFPEGHHHAWGADFVGSLEDDTLESLAEAVLRAEGESLWVALEHLGGAIGRVAASATAFPHRAARFGIISTVKWRPPGRPERALAAQARLHRSLFPASTGRYVNYIGEPHGADDVAAAYGTNLPRLRELKRRWDPENVFRHNVNIR